MTPADILGFWREAGYDKWFGKDDAFDAAIHTRFAALWRTAAGGELASWEASDDGALALVIVLDQFPRNMFRGTPQAFSSDALARTVAARAMARGADARAEPALRQFFYLPLMHSEDLADQQACVVLYEALGDPHELEYAVEHRDIIARFGRFPHRNRALGRATTADEQAYLNSGGFSG